MPDSNEDLNEPVMDFVNSVVLGATLYDKTKMTHDMSGQGISVDLFFHHNYNGASYDFSSSN